MRLMETFERIWDALVSPDEADDLDARSGLLADLHTTITSRGWDAPQVEAELQLSAGRAGQLLDEDINAFTLDELHALHTLAERGVSGPASSTTH